MGPGFISLQLTIYSVLKLLWTMNLYYMTWLSCRCGDNDKWICQCLHLLWCCMFTISFNINNFLHVLLEFRSTWDSSYFYSQVEFYFVVNFDWNGVNVVLLFKHITALLLVHYIPLDISFSLSHSFLGFTMLHKNRNSSIYAPLGGKQT